MSHGTAVSARPMPVTPARMSSGIRDRADQHDGEHVLAADALAEHEDVLGADGHDEREAESEAGEQGGHASPR